VLPEETQAEDSSIRAADASTRSGFLLGKRVPFFLVWAPAAPTCLSTCLKTSRTKLVQQAWSAGFQWSPGWKSCVVSKCPYLTLWCNVVCITVTLRVYWCHRLASNGGSTRNSSGGLLGESPPVVWPALTGLYTTWHSHSGSWTPNTSRVCRTVGVVICVHRCTDMLMRSYAHRATKGAGGCGAFRSVPERSGAVASPAAAQRTQREEDAAEPRTEAWTIWAGDAQRAGVRAWLIDR